MAFLPGIAAEGCCSRPGNSGIIESSGLSRRETSLAPTPAIVEVIVKVRLTAIAAICVALALVAAGCVTTKSLELPVEVVSASNVGAIAFEIVYDSALLEVTDVKPDDLAEGATSGYNNDTPGRLLVVVQGALINGDGTLVKVHFTLTEGTGSITLPLENLQVLDASTSAAVPFQTVAGSVSAEDGSWVAPRIVVGQ